MDVNNEYMYSEIHFEPHIANQQTSLQPGRPSLVVLSLSNACSPVSQSVSA